MGQKNEDGSVQFPEQLTPSSEHIDRTGVYLLENGFDIFIWMGRGSDPTFCDLIFGQPFDNLNSGKASFFFSISISIDIYLME